MAIRKIITYPDPILKAKAPPVEKVTDEIRTLIDDMVETMYAAPGIGLAAPQVGVGLRVVVIDVGLAEDEEISDLITLVNPEILEYSSEMISFEEGCLSVPDFEEEVDRSAKVKVKALGRDGEALVLEAEGLKSVCIQHEIDHLDGITIADRATAMKRNMYLKKVKKGKINHASSSVSI